MKEAVYKWFDKIIMKGLEDRTFEDLRKEYVKFNIQALLVIILLTLIIIFYYISYFRAATSFNSEKMIVMRKQLINHYYDQENLKKLMKEKLNDESHKNYLYTGDTKTDFDNYVLKLVTEELSRKEKERWKSYNNLLSKEKVDFAEKNETESFENEKYEAIDSNTFYVRLTKFKSSVTWDHFKKQLKEMEKYQTLILDLRDNPGGVLDQPIKIADSFLTEEKMIIKTIGAIEKEYKSTKGDKLQFKKIILLVNNSSASSSEVLAAALKDNLPNVSIIGTTTSGKGIGTGNKKFSDGTQFMYIKFNWLTPSGDSIHDKGIVPDIIIENSDNFNRETDYRTSKDLQYLKALELSQ